MTEPDALARAAVREIADRSPRPPTVAQLEGHTPLPHRAPPWVTRTLVGVVVLALAGLVVNWAAQMGDDADYVTGGPETTIAEATSTAPTSTTAGIFIDPVIGEWSSRIAGKTITYTATISCGICEAYGRWQITERDGTLLSASFLDTDRPTPQSQPFLFSDALRFASTADGFVTVLQSTPTRLSISVDPEKNAIDDEYSYDATDITFGDSLSTTSTSSTGAPPAETTEPPVASTALQIVGGRFLGIGSGTLLSDAAATLGLEPEVSTAIPALPGSTWTPCLTLPGDHWTITDGGLVLVFEGDTADTAKLTNWAYAGGPVAGSPSMATTEGIGIGSVRADLQAAYPALTDLVNEVDVNEPVNLRFGLEGDTVVWLGRVDCAAD